MDTVSSDRSRRVTSDTSPRRYIKDVATGHSTQQLHMVRCPFCDEPMTTQREPEFRSHLRTECEEAPREVNHGHADWRDELEEFAPEEDEDSSSEVASDRPDDAPGEVLPV